jgi:putative ABC transport system permease protein
VLRRLLNCVRFLSSVTRFRFWLWLIRLVGVIVPRRLRADWKQEWEAELRHREALLDDWGQLKWQTKLDLLRRSTSAFWDALWLQPNRLEDEMFQDLSFGLRMLLKNKVSTMVAVLTLALGIGANTAIFSVVEAVLLRPLPFADPERLVWLGGWSGNDKEQGVTPADFLDYRDQTQSFEQLAASISDSVPMNLSGDGEPERLQGGLVTTNYLDMFGVPPELGRTFREEDENNGLASVVVLSHSLWTRRFNSDPSTLNRTIILDKRKVTVIGVMPPQLQYATGVEIWQPFSFPSSPQEPLRSREFHMLRPVARLKSGVSLPQAQAEVEVIARQLQDLYPRTNANQSLFLMTLHERLVGNVKLMLLVLFGAVGSVLLIACANVANLLLARAASRQKEIAVRAALGASRRRLVQQLLTESLTLSLLGSVCGVLLAQWGVQLLVKLSAGYIPFADKIHLNATVLIFTLAVALITGLSFGIVPALQSTRLELTSTLKEGGKGASGGAQTHRTLNLLVVCEVSLAVVLMTGAGLLVNSFLRLQQVRLGFDEKNLLTARLELPNPYAQPAKKTQFFEQLQERVAALPGVEAVGFITELPLTRQSADFRFKIEGSSTQTSEQNVHADLRNINHDYFRAIQIPLLRGRNVTEAEVHDSAPVVLISDAFARRYFIDEDPLGKYVRMDLPDQRPSQIIGIVGDVRHRGLDGDLRPTIYFPSLRFGYSNVVIRTAGDPLSLANALREQVTAIDPNQPISNVRTMEQWVSESLAQPRFRTLLLGGFSAVALILAVVGIYGVMTYAVTQRTHEIGIRLALGAQTRDVLSLILKRGMKLAVFGVLVGLIAAMALTRLMESFLFGVRPTDPLTFAVTASGLLLIALIACWIPARRATRVDSMVALRDE